MRYLSLLLLFLAITSCEEVPVIVGGPGGPGPGEEVRKVLIEEFTGMRCVNCPAGSQAIEALIDQHGENLVAVSIHAGFFAQVYPETQQNLAIPEGAAIQTYLNEPLGYPSAVVNRKSFDGEESLQVGQSTWPGYIAQELAVLPSIKIEMASNYSDVSRELALSVDMTVLEALSAEDVRLSVYLTENNISDTQLTPAGQQNDYLHKHVFRKALSATQGDILSESFVANASFSRDFNFTLPEIWNAENCHAVAFVHFGGASREVLQVEEIYITE